MTHDTKTTMTLKMTMTRKLLLLFLGLQLFVVGLLLYLDENVFLLNFEIAFLVAILIMYASYQGYQKMIHHSVANDIHMEVKDPLDVIEDPYDLYDEESDEELDQKELKKRMKKDGLKKMVKTSAGHVSWKRLSAYAFLVLTFMVLKNNEVLNIAGYLIGLTFGIVTAVALGPKIIKS